MIDLIRNNIYRVKKDTRIGGCNFKKGEHYVFWLEEFIPYDFCTLFAFVKPPSKPDKHNWKKLGPFDIPPSESYILCRLHHNQEGPDSDTFKFLEETAHKPNEKKVNLPPRMPVQV